MSQASESTSVRDSERFAQIKANIASLYPNFQANAIRAWKEVIPELNVTVDQIIREGASYIPQVEFSKIHNLSQKEIERIKTRGAVVVRGVVSQDEATGWKTELENIVKVNPDVECTPPDHPLIVELYWAKPQVDARAHPNMLELCTWFNKLYHGKSDSTKESIDLSTPLTYADRFRIRPPGMPCDVLPPHIDGATIERWEETTARKCFENIFSGNWRMHDPYDIGPRVDARTSLHGRPNQCSVFRTFQGWLSMTETGPGEGTIRLLPDVHLVNVYFTLRPFFRPLVSETSSEIFDADNWEFDISSPDFPGIVPKNGGYVSWPSASLHPHLRLNETMTSVPKVFPGDTVFWHSDVVHSVEKEHHGKNDAAVMYIPAVPLTPLNKAYIDNQCKQFLDGKRPTDFRQGKSEKGFIGIATEKDIKLPLGRIAMGLPLVV
ncbi:hypothetical protein BDQ17DRAFT_1421771 [Cyathus striatus]|nr:hypothetical protein BDQ17DRAFT_1421771 [Cyathus striatus]